MSPRAAVLSIVLAFVFAGAVAVACSARSAAPWSDPDQIVPLDARVREGRLPNGLTYYVMRLPEASKTARLWLAVNAGSLEEDDDQRGIAHLVEHMAFRGTTHYPGEAIRSVVEHAGLEFGPDLNATTDFEQTLYKLAAVTDEPSAVDRGLDMLHEWASSVTFDPAALALEKKIVIEEHRLGEKTMRQRIGAARFAVIATGTDPA